MKRVVLTWCGLFLFWHSAMAQVVSVQASAGSAIPGDLITVNVNMTNPNNDLFAFFSFEVEADAAFLQVQSFSSSAWIGSLYANNSAGCDQTIMGGIFDACAHNVCSNTNLVNGSGNLISIVYRVVGVPTGGSVSITGTATGCFVACNAVPVTGTSISIVGGDCNGNSVPDSQEIATGAAPDCDGNGRPDECDVQGGFSEDCNGDGFLDSCVRAGRPESAIIGDSQAGHFLGVSMDVDGDVMIVGAPRIDYVGGCTCGGSARIYRRVGGNWQFEAELLPNAAAVAQSPAYRFGKRVAISGNTAVVGAIGHNTLRGAVYIYQYNGTSWQLVPNMPLTLAGGAIGDLFGVDVDIDGDFLIVGASGRDLQGFSDLGAAYTYQRIGGVWPSTFGNELVISNLVSASGLFCGEAVAVSTTATTFGATVYAMGCKGYDLTGRIDVGAALIFNSSGAGGFPLPVPACAGSQTFLGKYLELSGPLCVVSGDGTAEAGGQLNLVGSGVVVVYDLASFLAVGTLSGSIEAVLLGMDTPAAYGTSVAIAGGRVVAGAREDFTVSGSGASGPGAVYVFDRQSPGIWKQEAVFEISTASSGSNLGASVGVSGNQVFGGAPRVITAGGGTGVVGIFEPDAITDCNGNGLADGCEIGANPGLDCNHDTLIDTCQGLVATDCDSNGTPDACQIAMDASLDCDTNDILDSCDTAAPDCNSNTIPDSCDIASGSSMDASPTNGIPDECEVVAFRRGDANADGSVNVTDVIPSLNYLFVSGSPIPPCLKSLDVNDDGGVDLVDPVYVLGYLFLQGPAPHAPFPACGADGTSNVVSCNQFAACP